MAKRNRRMRDLGYRVSDVAIRAVLRLLLALPYDWRVPLTGWLVSHLLAPIAGQRRRVRENLALVVPDLPPADARRVIRRVPENLGRTLIELYSGAEFAGRVARLPITGPGLAAVEAAHAAGRPVMLVTGHIGNYDAIRAALLARGFRVGGLYRPMNNRYFNDHYVQAISRIGTPLFARGRQGLSEMLRFLRSGGMLGLVLDQSMATGARLTFFGKPALTALSAAEMALRYNALVVPAYGIRRPDGLSFDLILEAPIPAAAPEVMTQALNDSLEAQVRLHMDQWLWTHRRWKMPNGAAPGPEDDDDLRLPVDE